MYHDASDTSRVINTEILMNTQVVLGLSSTVVHRGSKKKKDTATVTAAVNNTAVKPKPPKITIKFTQKSNPKLEKQDNVGVGSNPKPENEEVLINLKKKKRKVEDEDVGGGGGGKKMKLKMKTKTVSKENEEDEEEGLECVFPTARITRIIKSQGFDCKITAEAVFLINKATEKFIELFSEDAYGCAVEDHKNFVGYKHLSSAVSKGNLFDFLSDFVPEKVTLEKALAERNPPATQQC